MKVFLAFTTLICVLSYVTGSPILENALGHRVNRNAEKVNELKSKLSRLQILIKELQHENDKTTVEVTSSTFSTPAQEEVMEPMRSDPDLKESLINKIAGSLTPKDVETLRTLKRMLETTRQSGQGDKEIVESKTEPIKGTFFDEPVAKEGYKEVSWEDIAKELQEERDSYFLQKNAGAELGQFLTHTEEGSFGPFRADIKESVEKNLLSDLDLAMKNGISVEEILKDLQGEGKTVAQNWEN